MPEQSPGNGNREGRSKKPDPGEREKNLSLSGGETVRDDASGGKGPEPSSEPFNPDEYSDLTDSVVVSAILDACAIDLAYSSANQRSQIREALEFLRQKYPGKPDEKVAGAVKEFGRWHLEAGWPGQVPWPQRIPNKWKEFQVWKKAQRGN